MVIGDVGQGAREEVDYAPAPAPARGANYGWNCREGLIAGPATDPGCAGSTAGDFSSTRSSTTRTTTPAAAAPSAARSSAATSSATPASATLDGRYLYGDLCGGELRSFDLADPFASDRSEGIAVDGLNSFGEDSCGRLYTVSGAGQVARLVGAQPTGCPLAHSATGIKAVSRSVERGGRALITAFVSPCAGRAGEPVGLFVGRRRVGVRRLSIACTANFRPRIARSSGFHASIESDGSFEASTSRVLTVRSRRPRRHR